jgi:diaminopimelate epimerase
MDTAQDIANETIIKFISMNGAGNKFLIHDSRYKKIDMNKDLILYLYNHKDLISFDQFVQINRPERNGDVKVSFWNSDGTVAEMCGNAVRCIAHLIIKETLKKEIKIETITKEIICWENGDNISVNMGVPNFMWDEIPLKGENKNFSTILIDLPDPPCELPKFSAVNVGNPHAVFFFNDNLTPKLSKFGKKIEKNKIFSKGVNVSFAVIVDQENINLSVWERGAGATLACGSAACATAVAAARLNLTKRAVTITLPGGNLEINWKKDDHIVMTGPYEFNGEDIIDVSNYK